MSAGRTPVVSLAALRFVAPVLEPHPCRSSQTVDHDWTGSAHSALCNPESDKRLASLQL